MKNFIKIIKANSNFSLIGDATNINVNGGQSGVGVDGYLDGVVIYADHDLSGDVSFGDYVTSSDPTGVFQIFGGKSPLIMYSGRDISTGNTFDVQYEAPAGYSVINPISSIIRAIETKDTTNTGSAKTTAAENKVASAIFSTPGTTVDFSKFNPYSSVSDSGEEDIWRSERQFCRGLAES